MAGKTKTFHAKDETDSIFHAENWRQNDFCGCRVFLRSGYYDLRPYCEWISST